jgi:hypothetical protein
VSDNETKQDGMKGNIRLTCGPRQGQCVGLNQIVMNEKEETMRRMKQNTTGTEGWIT